MDDELKNPSIGKESDDILRIKERKKSVTSSLGQEIISNLQPSELNPPLMNSITEIKTNKNDRNFSQFLSNNLNYNSFHTNDVIAAMENITEMKIEQIPDIIEAICSLCCQRPNTYRCYATETEGEQIEYFLCQEFSGQCMRLFCPVNHRKFSMKGKFTYNNNKENYDNSFLRMNKPLRCPLFCLCRPEFDIEYKNSTDNYEKIGAIYCEYSICDPIFVIYNNEREPQFYIKADCCQCGFMCRNNILGKTDEAHFLIYDYNKRDEIIGDICKQSASSYLSIADDFSVSFPEKADVKQKLLLMLTAIMIDYQFYEKNDLSYK